MVADNLHKDLVINGKIAELIMRKYEVALSRILMNGVLLRVSQVTAKEQFRITMRL